MGKTKIKEFENNQEEPEKKPVVEAAEKSTETLTHQPTDTPKKSKVSKRAQKKAAAKAKVRGKKYQEALKTVDRTQFYSLLEAIKLAQQAGYSKFPGTLEAHINTLAKNLRGLASLPHMSGKKLTILAFGKGADNSGADIVGTEETIAEIDKGKVNFDVVVTTPEWMPKLAKVARILGPRGLMPNPKSGTITDNLAKVITDLKQGKTEYKTEPNGQVIHLAIGKTNQPVEEVAANIKVLTNTVGKSRIKKVTLASTMGPGVKVNLSSI